jgi:type VI secretion system protein VasD
MRSQTIAMMVIAVILSACGFFKDEPQPVQPPPEPTYVTLNFEASGDINRSAAGSASPMVLRIYQLKSYTTFEKADFFSLFEKDDQLLGNDLVDKEEILLKPYEKRTVFFEPSQATQAIGLFAVFRDYKEAKWKASVGIQKNKTNVVNVYVSGFQLITK